MKTVRREKDLLPPIFFNRLKDIVLSDNFPWFFQAKTVSNKLAKTDNDFMFTHVLFAFEKGDNSHVLKDFEPILYFLDSKIKFKKIVRMKLNLYTNQNKRIRLIKHNDILSNTGVPNKHVTITILNFITCNGGTVIDGKEYPSNANEALIFNNVNEHFGIVQTDTQTRVALNLATE